MPVEPNTMDPQGIGLIIGTIFTGIAAVVGAWKGISADKKATSQETNMQAQSKDIEKALGLEKRLLKLEERDDDLERIKEYQEKDHNTIRDHDQQLIRFSERIGKLEVLPDKIDSIRDQLVKAETERARYEGVMTTKLDTIISRIADLTKEKK